MTMYAPMFLDNGEDSTYPAGRFRSVHRALFPRTGVCGLNELVMTQRGAGANLSVDVSSGRCLIPESTVTDPLGWRAYFCESNAIVNVPVTAAPGSNSRYDVVYAQARDDTVSGSDNDWVLGVVEGTASATPVEPTIPEQAIRIGRIVRTAGDLTVTTAMCKDRRQFTWRSYLAHRNTVDSLANDSSPNADTKLRAYLGANTIYKINGVWRIMSDANGDIKIGFTYPTGAVARWVGVGATWNGGHTGTVANELEMFSPPETNTTVSYSANSFSPRIGIPYQGVVKVGDEAGWLTTEWSQQTSHANATYMNEGSHLWAEAADITTDL